MNTIEPGYVAFNGVVFSAQNAQTYNNACADTLHFQTLLQRCPTSEQLRQSLELAQARQHKTFCAIIGVDGF